jgi:hypothetical protein
LATGLDSSPSLGYPRLPYHVRITPLRSENDSLHHHRTPIHLGTPVPRRSQFTLGILSRMPQGKQPVPKPRTRPGVAAAEVLAWVSDCLEGGLCFIAKGILVFENSQFGELVETPAKPVDGLTAHNATLRSQLFADAMAWNRDALGACRTSPHIRSSSRKPRKSLGSSPCWHESEHVP